MKRDEHISSHLCRVLMALCVILGGELCQWVCLVPVETRFAHSSPKGVRLYVDRGSHGVSMA